MWIALLFFFSLVAHADVWKCNTILDGLETRPSHQSISNDLFQGNIIQGHPVSVDGNNHSLWKVEIYNPKTGRTRWAYFKPRSFGDEDGWGRVPMEYVAYALNRRLGMDYIPPTVYRKGINAGGTHFDEGALNFDVGGTRALYDTDEALWGRSKTAVQSDHRVLSVLLQNPDGHYKNLRLGTHWVHGMQRPIFIDFAASLRPGTKATMTDYNLFRNSESVDHIRKETFEKLKNLGWEDLSELREFVSDDEIRAIFKRRDGIVHYFDKLIHERGWDNVVLNE